MRTFTNDQDPNVTYVTCPVCEGAGCDVCNFTGQIRVKIPTEAVKPSTIIIDSSDYEKDKLISEIGRLKLTSSTARKEYSAAYTFYKEIQQMVEKLSGEQFDDAFFEIIEKLREYQVDAVEPVAETLDLINDLRKANAMMADRVKILATHFELALEIIDREYKLLKDAKDDADKLNAKLMKEIEELKATNIELNEKLVYLSADLSKTQKKFHGVDLKSLNKSRQHEENLSEQDKLMLEQVQKMEQNSTLDKLNDPEYVKKAMEEFEHEQQKAKKKRGRPRKDA